MGWVEDNARVKAILQRDAPETWRDIKTSMEHAVKEYTRIYSPPGEIELQYAACVPVTPNCVRVRTVPQPGKNDISIEITFDPQTGKMQCQGEGLKIKLTFTLKVMPGLEGTTYIAIVDGNDKQMSPEDVSRECIQPLIDKLPQRPPNIAI